MRRSAFTGLILACLLVVIGSSVASAHPGATVFTIQLGAPTSISILVPADYGKPIDKVDVADAAGFALEGGEAPPGWSMKLSGGTVTFSGGLITLDQQFAVFAIRGVASAKGELLFPITTHSPDGSVMRYTGQPGTKDQAVIVYAGVVPHLPSRRGFPWLQVTGGTAAGIGVFGSAVIWLRRRREPDVLPPAVPGG